MESKVAIACLPLGLLPSQTHSRDVSQIYTVHALIYAYRKHIHIEGNMPMPLFYLSLFFCVR